jgi:hypothetical protein
MPFNDPIELFNAALAALDAERWHDATALCDPVSLAVFARDAVSTPTQQDDFPTVESIEELRALSPAELFAAYRDGKSERRQIEALISGGHVSAETAALVRSNPEALSRPNRSDRYEAIGWLPDGDRIAHVFYRHRATANADGERRLQSLPADEQALARDSAWRMNPQSVACRRQPDGGWLLLASSEFIGTATSVYHFAVHASSIEESAH